MKIINTINDLDGLKQEDLIRYTCKKCGAIVNRKYLRKYRKLIERFMCTRCSQKLSFFIKYGVESMMLSPEIRERIIQTNLRKYGVEYPAQNKEIYAKVKETNRKKYGYETSLKNEKVQEKVKATNRRKYGVENVMQNKDIHSKAEATMIDRYGAPTTLQSEVLFSRVKRTIKDLYGVDNSMQNKEIRAKAEATILKKYGGKAPACSKEIREKSKQTMIDKYGVENYSQTKEAQRNRRRKYSYDGENFDSSWEIALWIYAKDHGEPIERVEDPLEYYADGKVRYYFPDFKYKGRLVEIKGEQFINNGTMINPYDSSQNDRFAAKQQCAIDHGVKFMFENDLQFAIDYARHKFNNDKQWYNQFNTSPTLEPVQLTPPSLMMMPMYIYPTIPMMLPWWMFMTPCDFTPFSTNVFEREGMEFVDCECSYE